MRQYAKDGSLNETLILQTLNKHYYKDLSPKWQRHMKRMFKQIKDDDYINVKYYEYKDAKPDLEIIVNDRKILLSVKSGHAPTMHQELIQTFFDFLRQLEVPERITKIIAFYHYGYSLKKGATPKVLSRDEIIAKYPKQIKEANDFFRTHQDIVREIVYRSIIRGRLKRDLIDYFYYGNVSKGYLLSVSDIFRLIINDSYETCESIHFNQLTYVPGSRDKDSDRKHNIKINWPILCKWFYDADFMNRFG